MPIWSAGENILNCVKGGYLVFTKVIRKVGDHDLVLRWDAVLWGTTLLLRSGSTWLALRGCLATLVLIFTSGFVGNVIQGLRLVRRAGVSIDIVLSLLQEFVLASIRDVSHDT